MHLLHVLDQRQEERFITVAKQRFVIPGIPHILLAGLGIDHNEILLICNFMPVTLLCTVQRHTAAAMEIEQQRHLLLGTPQLWRDVLIPGLAIAVIAAQGSILHMTHKALFRKVRPLLIAAVGVILPAAAAPRQSPQSAHR